MREAVWCAGGREESRLGQSQCVVWAPAGRYSYDDNSNEGARTSQRLRIKHVLCLLIHRWPLFRPACAPLQVTNLGSVFRTLLGTVRAFLVEGTWSSGKRTESSGATHALQGSALGTGWRLPGHLWSCLDHCDVRRRFSPSRGCCEHRADGPQAACAWCAPW